MKLEAFVEGIQTILGNRISGVRFGLFNGGIW